MEPLTEIGEGTMARKNGLNRKEQIVCAKRLTAGVPAKAVAKELKTSVEVVKKFTQAKLDEAAKKAAARQTAAGKVSAAQKEKAAIVKEALKDDGGFE